MSNDSSVDRIAVALRRLAAAGRPGDPLPSNRELVARHGVGPVTVSRAVARLAAEGVVVTEPGRGTFVAAASAGAAGRASADLGWQTLALQDRGVGVDDLTRLLLPADPGTLVLSTAYLDPTLQPTRALSDAMARAVRRPGSWGRAPAAGIPELRAAFAGTPGADPSDVLVVPGGQPAIAAALRALVPRGGTLAVESPTYVGLLALARSAGLRTVPVPCDDEGLRPDLLSRTLEMTGARVVYCQPTFANPTGALMPAARRAQLLEVVRAAGAFLVEDDCLRAFSHADPPGVPPPLAREDADGHVVYVTSLTKVAAPSMRVGALVARGPAHARLRTLRIVENLFVPLPMQEAAVALITGPAWRRHLASLRRALVARRDSLIAALAEHAPAAVPARVPRGGLHLWLRLPNGVDDVELAHRCELRGLLVGAGTYCHLGEPPAPYVRMTYGAEPEERLAQGARLFGEVLAGMDRPGTVGHAGSGGTARSVRGRKANWEA